MAGKIYLIPVPLADTPLNRVLPEYNAEIVKKLRHFVVENIRSARRFLRKVDPAFDIDSSSFTLLNEQTPKESIAGMLSPAKEGFDIGIISEAGCPAVADPGADLVAVAQRNNIEVVPLVGPSSILMALMASGFNGQSFAFNGYLPIDKNARAESLRFLEKLTLTRHQTQIFIETPYRNNALVETLIHTLKPSTLLCVASDITAEQQNIKTKTIAEWAKTKYDFNKVPTIFLIHNS